MIIKGNRRGGARQLAAHLLRRDTNEEVHVREIDGYPANGLMNHALEKALRLIEAQGSAHGKKRVLYHAIIAPQAGEILTDQQLKHVLDTLADNLGLAGHTRVVVEHRKDGRQHFHVVFNVLDRDGKPARLQWTRKKEWVTARQLEQELGLTPVGSKSRAPQRWEYERGKRSGIDPLDVREEVTAVYRASKTGTEFVAALAKAGYVLTRGRNGSFVIVDHSGHVHGLMRRIEGARLNDLKRKFPDLERMSLPPLELVQKTAMQAFRASKPRKPGNKRGSLPASQCRSALFRTASFGTTIPSVYSAHVRNFRQPAAEERKAAFRAMSAIFARRVRSERAGPDPRPVRPWRYDPNADIARIIAWAFRNGRIDILALYGIFLPADFFV